MASGSRATEAREWAREEERLKKKKEEEEVVEEEVVVEGTRRSVGLGELLQRGRPLRVWTPLR